MLYGANDARRPAGARSAIDAGAGASGGVERTIRGLRRGALSLCCDAMSDDPQTRPTITLLPGRQKRAEGAILDLFQ